MLCKVADWLLSCVLEPGSEVCPVSHASLLVQLLMVRTDVEESRHHMPFVSRACPLLEAGCSGSAVSNNLHFAATADFAVLLLFSLQS